MSNNEVKKVVVKVGTSTLTYPSGRTNLRRMQDLVRVLSDLMNYGIHVVLVTSGAIGVGVGKMRLAERPHDTPGRQAAATVGQSELMFMYDKMFTEFGHIVGQLLITKYDVENDRSRNNLINTFDKLFEWGVIPIVNENDSIAVEEIVFGDNDSLSAIVAKLIDADALIILSDINGLYDADPAKNKDARIIPLVEHIDDKIMSLAGDTGSSLGTGGMVTKIHAAQIATAAGIDTILINGDDPRNIYRVLENEKIGTLFKAVKK